MLVYGGHGVLLPRGVDPGVAPLLPGRGQNKMIMVILIII